ncbi:MAG: glycosyltransferase [Zetaproteobacteria bacterium]|nr:glycosyltransferase [Zetaproteobacteria bacterium]
MHKLSIILPTYNETKGNYLAQILASLQQLTASRHSEVIAVDSGSQDATLDLLSTYGVPHISIPQKSRACRLNTGVEAAQGDFLVLHHPRSYMHSHNWIQLYDSLGCGTLDSPLWGGLTHTFDAQHPILRCTSWYSNFRVQQRSIVYLDHCILMAKSLAQQVFPIPDMDIFEDTEISRRLSRLARAQLLPFTVTTSALRFRKHGVYRQLCTNQIMKCLYHLKVSPTWMNRIYERSLQLNTEYAMHKRPKD